MVENMVYANAREQYAAVGVDTELALAELSRIPVSLHCWQGDDVAGFEDSAEFAGSSGCMATGNYPGKARNFDELRSDLEVAEKMIPGLLRLNLHAIYPSDFDSFPERDAIEVGHFQSWIDWAKQRSWGIDFNPTLFSHPKAADGFTLAHPDSAVRQFWVDHCIACRKIAAAIGEQLENPVVTNIWIPDGYKDTPADFFAPRARLLSALDEVMAADVSKHWNKDAVEAKLFGIGVESFTVGSNEFYLGYAATRQTTLCLDAGHFHPTESIAEKISAVLLFVPSILLHVSRGVRWDSDHIVTLDDLTLTTLQQCVASGALDRIFIGLDFFDASVNRIAAWAIGTRNTKKALLQGLLQPRAKLIEAEKNWDYTARLALMEDARSLPWGAVWSEFCRRNNCPLDGEWLAPVRQYEKDVLSKR